VAIVQRDRYDESISWPHHRRSDTNVVFCRYSRTNILYRPEILLRAWATQRDWHSAQRWPSVTIRTQIN